jgi:hypothetical protein
LPTVTLSALPPVVVVHPARDRPKAATIATDTILPTLFRAIFGICDVPARFLEG